MPSIFPGAVYLLCFLTSSACAFLLAQLVADAGAAAFWSALCFLFLGLQQSCVIVDLLVLPDPEFQRSCGWRSRFPRILLLIGLIWGAR
jgi:hypothetical protein